ncbi:MAG: NAD-dependent epimerase/dehydratase family protein [Cyclobacteriaceae bacterium]|jgi:UDP-glucose 4-epimerase|nr:NAD-dependent epimerase/dehydratase family protein [Cyclobacteriaceae bacterium]
MKKVLITGAAGNIGSALAHKLSSFGKYTVTGVDNFLTGSAHKLPALSTSFHFIKADVNNFNDISSIMTANKFDFVFHYAAVVGVQRTLDNPIKVLEDIQGIKNILDLSKNTGVKRVFYSSSSEVYGEPVEFPQNEATTPLNSRLPYAVVKNVGESFLRSYQKEYGLPYTIFRFFNTYGPRQSEDFVVAKFLKLALEGKPITLYGEGKQTRTFCFIDDNLDTTWACLENNHCINDVMNLGNDNEISIKELAEKIISITNSKSPIIHLPALAEGDMTRRKPDISKMRAIINRPLTTLEEGIQITIQQRMF